MKCGLLGRHLSHSYSPRIHSYLGNYSYDLYEKEPEALEAFLKNGDFSGLNVTIPYKKVVMAYLNEVSPTAVKMGAVNTIVRRPDGSLWGHNTDYAGFASMVRRTGISLSGKKALVLGSGGASGTAVQVLQELGARTVVISRSGEDNYSNLSRHFDAALVVNATPVGMYPDTGISPLDLDGFHRLEGVLDLIYNPARTKLLLEAERRGIPAENGLWMLVAQAKEAAECFTGTAISDTLVESIHRRLSRQMQNLVLVGMPGCGKTVLGTLLAEQTGKRFVDADEEVVKLAGNSIPAIFKENGEEAFRQLETQVLAKLGKQSGLVISTGGGCVTRQRNYELLHQNGTILWVQRDPEALSREGRPLSRGSLQAMYEIRKPMYEAFSDLNVQNDAAPEDCLGSILQKLEELP